MQNERRALSGEAAVSEAWDLGGRVQAALPGEQFLAQLGRRQALLWLRHHLIAAEMSGRACRAVELSPAYVDVAALRWQAFTGHEAVLEGPCRHLRRCGCGLGGGNPAMTQGTASCPIEENRRIVRAMSGYRVPHAETTTMLRADPKMLRKHCRDGLERGSVEATARVGQNDLPP